MIPSVRNIWKQSYSKSGISPSKHRYSSETVKCKFEILRLDRTQFESHCSKPFFFTWWKNQYSFEATIRLWEYQIVCRNMWAGRFFFSESIAFAISVWRVLHLLWGTFLYVRHHLKESSPLCKHSEATNQTPAWSLPVLSIICTLEVCPHFRCYSPISRPLKFWHFKSNCLLVT